MDENTKELINEIDTSVDSDTKDEAFVDPLKEAIEAEMKKIQSKSMLIGTQTFCHVVLEKIALAMNRPGKRTMNDYKRLIKDIQTFCEIGISRNIDEDSTDKESAAETVQN